MSLLWTSRMAGKPSFARVPTIGVLRRLGLAASLELCLDAGDANSYAGSGQNFLDTSGKSLNFFLGADGSATATDPTFNGSAGALSSAEYFSYDGGDYHRLNGSNTDFINSLHKDNAAFTLLSWVYPTSTINRLFGTSVNGNANHGVYMFSVPTSGTIGINVSNGTGAYARSASANVGVVADAWQCIGLSMDEAANTVRMFRNGTVASANASYTSPSSDAASYAAEIGAAGNGTGPEPSGTRRAIACMWSKPLSAAEMTAIFNAQRGRFGV
jgi:hypothetical protein